MNKPDEQDELCEGHRDHGRYTKGRVLGAADAEDEALRNFVTLVTRLMTVYKVRSVMLNLMTDDEHELHASAALAGEEEDEDEAPTKPAPSAVAPTMRAGRRNDN